MIRLISLTIAAVSLVALSGFPAPEKAEALRIAPQVIAVTLPHTTVPLVEPAARWRESRSLLVLATGLFGAAFVVNRRQRHRRH